ncbi:Piwi domain-containing protein [Melampsora americana]|nr:Piwi domain-containing protein [Melampsora americana]
MPESLIVRPSAPGSAGQPVTVTVNAYKVTLPSKIIHHYDVAVDGMIGKGGTVGDVPPKFGRELFTFMQNNLNAFGKAAVVYDGRKNLYSPERFDWPGDCQSFSVDMTTGKNSRKFTVKLTKVADIKLDNLVKYVNRQVGSTPDEGVYNAVNALNVLCNHDLMMLHPNAKNKFFPQPEYEGHQLKYLKGAIEMWRGYFSSIRMVPGGAILNFDLSSQPMIRAGNLVDVAADIAGLGTNTTGLMKLRPQQVTQLTRALRSIRVTVKRSDGTKFKAKVKEYGPLTARTHKFTVEEAGKPPRTTTVQNFFQEHYGVTLRSPDLPVVKLSAKAWYPIELCNVDPGQKYIKKLEPDQLADAIRWLTVKPYDRTQMLSDGVAKHLRTSVTPVQWGLRFDPHPMTVKARRLPPPVVNHMGRGGKKESTRVDNGTWNMANRKVFSPAPPIKNWIAVVFGAGGRFDQATAQKSLSDLRSSMIAAGLTVESGPAAVLPALPNDSPMPNTDGKDDSVGKWIMSKLKQKPQLIVCYLRDKNAWQYRQLKIFGDTAQGVPSQCMAIDKIIGKGNAQYYANVTLKINAKLGGMNHVIGSAAPFLMSPPTMVMGADVTHPGADSLEPSIAGLVGSTNQHGLGYAAEFSVQPGRQEIIGELDTLAQKLLQKYHDRNAVLPKRIVFYRDGVSEGQFSQVLALEVPLLRKAIAAAQANPGFKKQPNGPITLTFIVCGKRHHFKFGPHNPAKDGDRNGNLLPGIVVDTGVVHPFDFDWYGLSHAGLLGTSRSAHYTVLIDDAKHKADDLQTLTYHLCYLYSRATRSVSIATPAYYAHHICTRIKQFLSTVDVHQGTSSTPTQVDVDRALTEYQNRAAQYKAGFDSVYQKARATNPVPEYWM